MEKRRVARILLYLVRKSVEKINITETANISHFELLGAFAQLHGPLTRTAAGYLATGRHLLNTFLKQVIEHK